MYLRVQGLGKSLDILLSFGKFTLEPWHEKNVEEVALEKLSTYIVCERLLQ